MIASNLRHVMTAEDVLSRGEVGGFASSVLDAVDLNTRGSATPAGQPP
ncbi:hypothetical protein [Streptomyces sp. NPDC048436]